MINLRIYRNAHKCLLLTCVLLVCLSACASGLSSKTRQHAQDVFLHHNQLVSELISFASDSSLTDTQLIELEQAEAVMIEACKPLNTLAAEVRDGGKSSFAQRVQILRSLDNCEHQTNLVQQLLSNF